MSRNIAVDIALLPPTGVIQKIISITSNLPKADTRLNDTDCLPHITLAMGILDIDNLLTYDSVHLSNFISPPEVSKRSTYWVQHYAEHHKSPDDFNPHITLGEGVVDKLDGPIKYSDSRLAICHLGTYCTCRKILTVRD